MCEQCETARRSTAPRWRGRYDRAALRRSCQRMGISRPVRLLCTESAKVRPDRPLPRQGIDYGYQTYDPGRREHVVSVTRNLPLDIAGETLVHELTHCVQTEREGFDPAARARHMRDEDLYGYYNAPHEVEARASVGLIGPLDVLREGEPDGRS